MYSIEITDLFDDFTNFDNLCGVIMRVVWSSTRILSAVAVHRA